MYYLQTQVSMYNIFVIHHVREEMVRSKTMLYFLMKNLCAKSWGKTLTRYKTLCDDESGN